MHLVTIIEKIKTFLGSLVETNIEKIFSFSHFTG